MNNFHRPSALFWNIGSLGNKRNVPIITDKLNSIVTAAAPEVICFAEASTRSLAFAQITLVLAEKGYGSEPSLPPMVPKALSCFGKSKNCLLLL
jgi:hypothetical protein